MIFWLLRLRFTNTYKRKTAPRANGVVSLRA
jgi:hypothetical protein